MLITDQIVIVVALLQFFKAKRHQTNLAEIAKFPCYKRICLKCTYLILA